MVFSMLVIIAWFGLIAEGAHALYADTATLAANSISSGSTDLQVSNSQSASSTSYADSRTGFSFALNPGESDEKYFFLKNVSTSNTLLDIDVAAGNASGVSDIVDAVAIEFTPVDSTGSPVGQPVTCSLGYYLANHVGLGVSIDKGGVQRFKVRASLKQLYATPGQSVSYDLVFTGTQHVGS